LGDSYSAETRVLRKAGRTLSELRDARSVIEILGQLQEKQRGQLRQSAAAPIRRGLVERKKRSEERESPGERIYQKKRRKSGAAHAGLWAEWLSEPKSLEQFEKKVRKRGSRPHRVNAADQD
jgi:hypothetical protein